MRSGHSVPPHAPPQQVPDLHWVPQLPQLDESTLRFLQVPPQFVSPGSQTTDGVPLPLPGGLPDLVHNAKQWEFSRAHS